MKAWKAGTVALYLAAIVAANVMTARLAPPAIGPFIVPAGTFLIGATFVLRDLVQNAIGRTATYFWIAVAMVLSAFTSYALGDTLWIVFASALTFLFSETVDTELYTRLRLSMSQRVLASGTVGSLLDSAIFVVVGLSPLGAGFLGWDQVGRAIAGQAIIKTALQLVGALVVGQLLRFNRVNHYSR
ncbi:MAG TPA: VUT family protein [Paenibacillaceae bacterium]